MPGTIAKSDSMAARGMRDIFDRLLPAESVHLGAQSILRSTLRIYGRGALQYIADAGIRICVLAKGQSFIEASAELKRLGEDVDLWEQPPSGLFVPADRRVYLRSISPFTVVHELAHALDLALGGDSYFSYQSVAIRKAFAFSEQFVSEYACEGIDEYFAEGVRAYLGVNVNLHTKKWPRVSRTRLRDIDPTLHAIISDVFTHVDTIAA